MVTEDLSQRIAPPLSPALLWLIVLFDMVGEEPQKQSPQWMPPPLLEPATLPLMTLFDIVGEP